MLVLLLYPFTLVIYLLFVFSFPSFVIAVLKCFYKGKYFLKEIKSFYWKVLKYVLYKSFINMKKNNKMREINKKNRRMKLKKYKKYILKAKRYKI